MADDLPPRPSSPRVSELFDHTVERAVLAAALLDAEGAQRVIPRVAAILEPAHFHHPAHGVLWEVFLTVHGRGDPVDVLTVTAELRARERLNTIGGAQYVGELTDEIPTVAHCEAHAAIVLGLALRRAALATVQSAATRLTAGEPLPLIEADVHKALRGTGGLGGAQRIGRDMKPLKARIDARRQGSERPLQTPWPSVSQQLGGGLWPGMYVLVGNTGAGKTQWAMQLAVDVAKAGGTVVYVALELSREDLAARAVGDLARIPWSKIQRGEYRDEDESQVVAAMRKSEALPLYTECAVPYGYGAELLQARAWTLRPALVVLDYLQLCVGRAGEDPRHTVGRVSYVTRSIARDLGCAVLVLSSTARDNYAKLVCDEEKDPAELVGLGKESGEIEYAADGVLVLAKNPQAFSVRTFVVAKNRFGPAGRITLNWSGTSFSEPLDPPPLPEVAP